MFVWFEYRCINHEFYPVKKMKKILSLATILMLASQLVGCGKQNVEVKEEPIRGLKTKLISERQNSELRRYPSVLQPSESTSLSFQISGQLGENKLSVGQKVKAGDVLLELDKTALNFEVQEAKAALDEAIAAEKNARREFTRNTDLKQQGLIGQVTLDNSETNLSTAQARVAQANNRYAVAQDKLVKATLIAPYDGVINNVLIDSFDSVTAGMAVANLYNPSNFEARFSVSYGIASMLSVGKEVSVGISGFSNLAIPGTVTELASSTDIVSSFPVVVRLTESHSTLKAGLAVQVSMEFPVTEAQGYLIPFSAVLVNDNRVDIDTFIPTETIPAKVFLFNEADNTVMQKTVALAGVRDNQLIVTDGLEPGDRVATAGVAFLREGQIVKLLDTE